MLKRALMLLPLLGTFAATAWSTDIIPADRMTVWNPGLNSVGGVPNRTTIFATINAATYGNGASDATAGIQAKLDACPNGQVVLLSAGTFTINSDILYIRKSITLRGAGATQTTLQRTNGATPGSYIPGVAMPVIIVGPNRWTSGGTSYNLAADAVKGNYSVQLATAPAGGFSVGQIVKIDELSGASWQTDPEGRGQIWASPDFRVVYQRHNPAQGTDDPWPDAAGWFCRQDRPTSDIKEVQSYNAATKTVTFTSPFHIDYRTSHTAQLYVYVAQDTHVKNAGVEDIKLQGGDDGLLRFERAAYCWAARVENTAWLGEGFAINDAFRVEVRDSYVHTPVWFEPGGGSYNISLASGSSEVLIENNISMDADKVMVSRCSGAGSVVGYNYMDDGHIGSSPGWVEIGLNASHMVGCHHVLFEGNYCFNADSDHTHGNSILNTYYRNHLSGQRRSYTDDGPRRCGGLMAFSYWMAFAGNVLGQAGQMSGWVYESQSFNDNAIWMLGWDGWSPYPADPNIIALTYRHGNFDYLTNTQKWDPTVSNHTLPNSLYLTVKPAFFGSLTWPWVQPEGTTKLYTLPARKRFDGTPPNNAPTIVNAAAATPNPVTATTTNLSVLGADDGGEPSLTYTWTVIGTPPASVNFSANASNAAKNTTATFSKAGTYNLLATINDTGGLSVTSSVSVVVNQTLTSIVVTPASANVVVAATQPFSAAPKDQFGAAMTATVTWTVSGGGTINSSGLFTAGSVVGGPFTVTAKSGTKSGTASVKVIAQPNRPPVISSAAFAAPNPAVAGQSVSFTAAATDPDNDPLTYAWDFGDLSSATGTPASHTYAAAGIYTASVTVSDGKGGSVVSKIVVTVNSVGGGGGGGGLPSGGLKINFQPANAPMPSGYFADTGAVFGDRGNGFSYGWNVDNSSAARDRNSPASPDQRYDTLQHMQKPANPNAVWEVALPNGSYTVRVVSGDPSFFDSVFKLNVEGVLTVNGQPSRTTHWIEGSRTVTVADGRLTISNATGSSNNKICFVEITDPAAGAAAASSIDFKSMTVTSVQTSINFSKSAHDTLKVSAIPDLPSDLALAGLPVGLDLGGAIATFTLDQHGHGKNNAGVCALKFNRPTKTWTIKISQKGSFAGVWLDAGMDKSQKQLNMSMPVTLTIGTQTYGGEEASLYQNKSGKLGTLKNSSKP